MTLGSLFDGIAGFPLAASKAGIETIWASEIEPFPIAVSQFHFPEIQQVGDITKLCGADLPPVDIICGGSPCKDEVYSNEEKSYDFSVSGHYDLWCHFYRLQHPDRKRRI